MAVKKRYTIDDILSTYEKRRQGAIKATMDEIMALFDAGATKASVLAAKRKLINNRFLPKDVRDAIDRIVNTVTSDVEKVVINGIRQVWDISNEKNDLIAQTVTSGSGRKPPKVPRTATAAAGNDDLYNKNTSALEAFLKRKDNGGKNSGLNLSKRVFKLSNAYKQALNEALADGINEGLPAREIAKKTRQYLRTNRPVANPGQGVYSNPQRNAERLARTEINMAYANADYERWNQQWFVIGIEIRLSNRHPTFDICDSLKGKYPKEFHFTGWHPNCLCIAIPILAPQEVRDAMMDYRLGITDKRPTITYVEAMPKAASSWVKENAERINAWSNTPYWVENNPSFITSLLK